MLDHDHRVAEVAQPLQRIQQPVVVALMEPDGWFVQHVKHARAGPIRSALARRIRCDSPPESVPALRLNVRYSSPTLFRNPRRSRISFRIARRDLVSASSAQMLVEVAEPRIRLADRHLRDLAHMQRRDLHRQRFRFQPVAAAILAIRDALIALDLLARPGAVGLAASAVRGSGSRPRTPSSSCRSASRRHRRRSRPPRPSRRGSRSAPLPAVATRAPSSRTCTASPVPAASACSRARSSATRARSRPS